MARYKVKISSHHSEIVTSTSIAGAKTKAWNSIKNGYTYGYDNKAQFNKGVVVEKL